MPGAEYDQVARTMQLADRVSVNLEGATAERLSLLAPKKDYWGDLIQRLQWISQIRNEQSKYTSIATQFVVGAVGDTDLELLSVSERLYKQMGLRRAYYSTFSPVDQTPLEGLPATDPLRGFRLYQASFLLRDYGWDVEDLPFTADQNLPLTIDPKAGVGAASPPRIARRSQPGRAHGTAAYTGSRSRRCGCHRARKTPRHTGESGRAAHDWRSFRRTAGSRTYCWMDTRPPQQLPLLIQP